MQRLRAPWLRVHRWVALSVGWIVASVGVIGAVLVVGPPIDRWAHPALFRVAGAPSTGSASLDAIRARVVAVTGDGVALTFRPPREPGDSLWVVARGRSGGTWYFDPATGRSLGHRADGRLLDVLFKLHSSLLLEDTGKAILACLALVYLAMLVTGLVLWWPRRWPPSWRIEWRGGTVRTLFDLHRSAGAAMGLLIAVSVATGAFMAWRPIGDALNFVVGDRKVVAPTLAKTDASTPQPGRSLPPASLDLLVERAQARFPNDRIGFVQVFAQPGRPVRIRFKLADDPHPNGLTSVWLDPQSGAVLRVDRWNELDLGAKAAAFLYPLHTGQLGGPALEAVAFLNGLALGTLAISGTWLWWRRRNGPSPSSRSARRAGSLAGSQCRGVVGARGRRGKGS